MPSTLRQDKSTDGICRVELVMLRVYFFGQKLRVCFCLDKYSNNLIFLWKMSHSFAYVKEMTIKI